MSLKQLLRLRLATKIAKSARNDTLFKLIMDILNSNSPLAPGGRGDGGEGEYSSRLADIFSDYPITQYSEVYASVLATIRRIYTPAKILPPHQQEALAETVYQRSLNLFHLAEYAARGTRYVQVSAIMDSRTTSQCRQMNGRIFATPALQKEVPNQPELVRSDDYWANAAYFRGVPTPDIVPSLPPYHYNCRTRIVPYTMGNKYHDFDSLPASDPDYTQILADRLNNYQVTSKHLPAIVDRANTCKWNPEKLSEHYTDHNRHFDFRFNSAQAYNTAAFDLLNTPASTKCLRIEGSNIILYAMQLDPKSRSKAWFFVIYELFSAQIKSFYKNSAKDIRTILNEDNKYKSMVFDPVIKAAKMEINMDQLDIDRATAEWDELFPLDFYEHAITVIKTQDTVCDAYCQSIASSRTDTLHILIVAGVVFPFQLARIKKIDDFILAHPVPPQFDELKAWLLQNPLSFDVRQP